MSTESFVSQAAIDSESSQGMGGVQTSRHAESRTRAGRTQERGLGVAEGMEASNAPVPSRGPNGMLPEALRRGERDRLVDAAGQRQAEAGEVRTGAVIAPVPAPSTGGGVGGAIGGGDVRELLRRLASELGEEVFERYFLGQTKLARSGDGLLVTVTSSYLAQLLDRRFGDQLRRATGATTIRFEVDRSVFTGQAVQAVHAAEAAGGLGRGALAPLVPHAPHAPHAHNVPGQVGGSAVGGVRARPVGRATPQPMFRHSLDTFVVGHANRLGITAVRRLVESPIAGAPVFVHGACGLGKTHLLQGACAAFQASRPGATIRYVTGEHFTNDFIMALRNNKVDGFRKMYRGVDLLCIDDIHFLASKDATQQELLHTFDAVGLMGSRILIASDEHPREIRKLSEKLVSRFLACCVVRLDTPDLPLRKDLVRHLAARRLLPLDDQAIEVLIQRSAKAVGSLGGFGGSVRELEGLLNQVEAMARLLPEASSPNGLLGAGMVMRALGIEERAIMIRAASGASPRRPIAIRTIIEQVCRGLSVDVGEFAGKGRHKRVVFARSVCAHLARVLTTQSFPEIARAMGRPNHSTVITAQRRLQKQLESGPGSLVEAELAPQHPGVSYAELLETLTTQIRTCAA